MQLDTLVPVPVGAASRRGNLVVQISNGVRERDPFGDLGLWSTHDRAVPAVDHRDLGTRYRGRLRIDG